MTGEQPDYGKSKLFLRPTSCACGGRTAKEQPTGGRRWRARSRTNGTFFPVWWGCLRSCSDRQVRGAMQTRVRRDSAPLRH
jgi:hypothetical protein